MGDHVVRILVVKLVSLGDNVVCTAVVRAIREKYPRPEHHITLLTSAPYSQVWEGSPHIDRLKMIPALSGIWNQGLAIYAYDAATCAELQREHYDKLLELNQLGWFGEYRRNGDCFVQSYAAIADVYPLADLHYEIPCDPAAEHTRLADAEPDLAGLLEQNIAPICLHIGGGWGLKVLPEHAWIPIVQALFQETHAPIVCVGGPADHLSDHLQRDLETAIWSHAVPELDGEYASENKLYDLSGQIGIKTLYYLLTRSRLFIGADSGPMHLASAANCPTVAYYSVTSQFVGTPISDRFVTVQSEASCDAPCGLVQCRTHELCVKLIDPEHLIKAAHHVLSGDEPAQAHWKGDRPTVHYFDSWDHVSLAQERPPLAEWLKQRPMLDPTWHLHT